ncbi:MAG: hypothetical protein A2452_09625 [Candidatus Firestonebacteria bacterium RIFOXYC2_FULL_39_67]|nr:MAG: hypothetical protein A2536_07060 [Candidatus Firestonebacteria bacterium RIFOXYD2_FULL_39_29]OGF54965.1 MAG: hypothetical protein A2497_04130 [Candidatus Firestonebacteria bacterium RifOxyC12_full_39_7]OGF56709.1 MAG: hypothetical protein A2452_09625 [Candidatus Firestonebacteria bacterium RIFOXYC2_FULL_39_67]
MQVFDTDVIIDALRGVEPAKELLLKYKKNNYISAITRGEVYFGMRKEERYRTVALLDCFKEIPVDKEIIEIAYDIKKVTKNLTLTLNDCLICATAVKLNEFIVTRNAKHYPSKYVRTIKPRY